jgi:hypothetical protein
MMDVDVAWCLTCSRRTVSLHASHPARSALPEHKLSNHHGYCSPECCKADSQIHPLLTSSTVEASPRTSSTAGALSMKTSNNGLDLPLLSYAANFPVSSISVSVNFPVQSPRQFTALQPRKPASIHSHDGKSSGALPPFYRKIVASHTTVDTCCRSPIDVCISPTVHYIDRNLE